MNATPNNALQRTRAAVSLQSVRGGLSIFGRRRAPLSLGPFGDRQVADRQKVKWGTGPA
jgi:hypothetical protein